MLLPPHPLFPYHSQMPCDCELDLEQRLVRACAWGTVTFDEAIAARRKFTTDPNFKPDFNQIYDVRGVTRINIVASEIGLMAMDDVFGPNSRRALVAPRSDTYGFGRTFQLYRQINAGKEQIKIFLSIEDAEAWLSA
jgi:hypothetical protein